MEDGEKLILIEQMKVINQMILEVRHAQYNGSDWYTKGDSGLYQQVSLWLGKGTDALFKVNKLLLASQAEETINILKQNRIKLIDSEG